MEKILCLFKKILSAISDLDMNKEIDTIDEF